MGSEPPWTETENALLTRLVLQAIPGGIYGEEPLLLWIRVAQRMRKKPVKGRIYNPDVCREQYLTHIKPHLRLLQYPIEERPWSKAEIYSLQTHISRTLPEDLDEASNLWSEIAEKVAEDGLVADIPLRLYDGNNVREQYMKHVRPSCVPSIYREDAIKEFRRPDVVRSKAAASTKMDTNNAKADLIEPDTPSGRDLDDEEWDALPEPLLGRGQSLD